MTNQRLKTRQGTQAKVRQVGIGFGFPDLTDQGWPVHTAANAQRGTNGGTKYGGGEQGRKTKMLFNTCSTHASPPPTCVTTTTTNINTCVLYSTAHSSTREMVGAHASDAMRFPDTNKPTAVTGDGRRKRSCVELTRTCGEKEAGGRAEGWIRYNAPKLTLSGCPQVCDLTTTATTMWWGYA
ncbi:hypothetical protein CSAL01_02488 [Colletotrichum salicis]|uniref:Uncharacterized protein n=1 Tax=Colletotrichum salicis TaxID=1209931 RepID=A0A135UHP2_9PEZI|nr:hypothetical protein CSAL01_02488 [Colletotrichum salicis]